MNGYNTEYFNINMAAGTMFPFLYKYIFFSLHIISGHGISQALGKDIIHCKAEHIINFWNALG
jgi:hypothetical protein